MLRKRVLGFAVAAAAAAGTLMVDATVATAQDAPWPIWRRGDGYTYFERRRTSRPERGFEGFAGPPMQQSYCSYRRIPNRECGPKGCRVTSWTLEQYCQ
jgi:hypothetical protein